MMAFVFVPLIVFVSANNGLLSKISSNKSLVFLGEISYGIYILQKPVYEYVIKIMKYLNIHSSTFIFYTFLIVLILFSALSYKFFEVPLRNIINRKVVQRLTRKSLIWMTSHNSSLAIWRVLAFLESSLSYQSFVYICDVWCWNSATSPSCKTLCVMLKTR